MDIDHGHEIARIGGGLGQVIRIASKEDLHLEKDIHEVLDLRIREEKEAR